MTVAVIVLLASVYLAVAPFYEAPFESTYCLTFIVASIPVYFMTVQFKLLPTFCVNGAGKNYTFHMHTSTNAMGSQIAAICNSRPNEVEFTQIW